MLTLLYPSELLPGSTEAVPEPVPSPTSLLCPPQLPQVWIHRTLQIKFLHINLYLSLLLGRGHYFIFKCTLMLFISKNFHIHQCIPSLLPFPFFHFIFVLLSLQYKLSPKFSLVFGKTHVYRYYLDIS
jgi:hypothetical protein